MNSLLIQGVLLNGNPQDILIEGNKIAKIAPSIPIQPQMERIEGNGLIAVPGLANLHTHAAMTLFRGYGDDLPLQTWLEKYIWPVEAHLSEDDVYWGVRLACLEMACSGTTCFLDMYSFPHAIAQAVEDSGMRAVVCYTLFDRGDVKRAQLDRECCYKYKQEFEKYSDRVVYAIAPHAIYTVSGPQLTFCNEFAQQENVLVHLHLSETEREIADCIAETGMRPVLYLDSIGALSNKLILAHSLHLNDQELDVIAHRGAATVHNPASNMKLSSGIGFRFDDMLSRNIPVGIGTDGCSSSNNLDMYVAMRLAALLGKASTGNPTACNANDIYAAATYNGYQILGINAGKIEEGALADICLIKKDRPILVPCHNLVSNLVYSSDSSIVDTTIVNGNIIMKRGEIKEQDIVVEEASKRAYNLIKKYGVK